MEAKREYDSQTQSWKVWYIKSFWAYVYLFRKFLKRSLLMLIFSSMIALNQLMIQSRRHHRLHHHLRCLHPRNPYHMCTH
jgi:hypothetical protein